MKFPLLVSLLLFGAFAAGAHATEFEPAGGSGSRQDPDICPSGEYLAGAQYRSGAWMDQIRTVCAEARTDGTLGVPALHFPPRGGNGGAARGGRCPANQIVMGIHYTLTINNQVRAITFFCGDLELKNFSQFDVGASGGGATEKPGKVIQSCDSLNTREAVTGLKINSGEHVNALGVVCGRLPKLIKKTGKPRPPVDPQEVADMDPSGKTPAQCQDAFRRNQQRCDNRFGVVDSIAKTQCILPLQQLFSTCVSLASKAGGGEPPADGGGTQTATVVKPVDVFDAPGGNGNQTGSLRKGAKVDVLGCQDNWCHVKGNKVPGSDGFVYNGPDYRSLQL